ncbi:hypothetical protein BJY52DRAFT_369834 [Lactarius psammicola]|nr:hypothetical protein BJY52DRAFT_369834 [Lactarius psammicola]
MSVRLGRPSGRNIATGLPSGPRSRSAGRYETRERVTEHDRGREKGNSYSSYRGAPPIERTRSVGMQRSMADMSPARGGRAGGRGGPTSYSDIPDVPPLPRLRHSDVRSESSASSRSTSSSSASSTFVGRVKGRGGYASSRTSLEDDPEPRKETGREWGGWLRQRTAAVPEPEHVDREDGDDDEPPVQSEYGLSLWSRVATAANTLTVSVSKAWATNITAHSGEQTPPGEESRLTRAMKAYHLEKARDPTDLPPWLFEEHERRPLGRPSASTWQPEASEPSGYESRDDTAPPRGRGLRDIYDAAAAATSTPPRKERREMSRGRQDDVGASHSSKANDRLKALRDAKRNAVQQRNASVSRGGLESTNDGWSSAQEEYNRGYGSDGRPGNAAHSRRAPSLPTGVRPGVGSGLPPRPSSRR